MVAGGNLLNDGIEMCGLSHAARAAGCDKVIIGIDCTDDDFFCAAYAAVDSMSSCCVWSVSCCTGSGT